MNEKVPSSCPRCGAVMEAGFANKAAGLSFVAHEKLKHFAFLDEDISHAGLAKLFPSRAQYFRSALCRSCELYLIDYSATLDRAQAEQVAQAEPAA